MSVLKTVTRYLIPTILCFLAAFVVQLLLIKRFSADIRVVIQSLSYLESYRPLPQKNPGPRVLVGFGGCVDLRVHAPTFFSHFKGFEKFADNAKAQSSQLNTLEDVLIGFAHTFASGAAAERVVNNYTLYKELVSIASKLVPDHLKTKLLSASTISEFEQNGSAHSLSSQSPVAWYSLGGNAPIMASRLTREGAQVSLAARLSERQLKHLPTDIKVLTAPPDFGLPEVAEEDIHLVLEYEKGDRFSSLVAPRANRYILVHDKENPLLSGLWSELLPTWQKYGAGVQNSNSPILSPDLFVLGGVQVMDSYIPETEPDLRYNRLDDLETFLSQLSTDTLVHFEMASYVDQEFTNRMLKKVLPYVDSIGLNEQELPNLSSLLVNGSITTVSSSYPRAAQMLDSMRLVWSLLNDPNLPDVSSEASPRWRRLSRIHLHTLAYQMIMVRRHARGGQAARLEMEARRASGLLPPRRTDLGLAWPFTKAAAAKASLIAHRHTCASSDIDPIESRLLMDDSFAVTNDPQRWKSALAENSKQIPRIHFNDTEPVNCWTESEPRDLSDLTQTDESEQVDVHPPFDTVIQICVAPVLVCSKVKQTAGCGDNISAGALRVQTVPNHPV